jgi:uncharacterized protein with NRDE domain
MFAVMCLVAFDLQTHPDYDLLVAANRDEFFHRATDTAGWWGNGLLGGQDLEAGGTWLGTNRDRRFAALTNFRGLNTRLDEAPSRGELPVMHLAGEDVQAHLELQGHLYSGHNLIFGAPEQLHHYSNVTDEFARVPPGIHGLSNASLNTQWPKVEQATAGLAALHKTSDEEIMISSLFALLTDATPAADDRLPETGVGRALERGLSPIFIRIPTYGTRCSTIVLFRRDGSVRFIERSWTESGDIAEEVDIAF